MGLPIPGSVTPGQLLIDAQTRQLWFGVPDTVDVNLSILVGDIVALQAEDLRIRSDTAAALASGLATKAPTVHTHTAAQITDFTAAVNAVVGTPGGGGGIPAGCIIMYSGLRTNVGVGALSGYVFCDGTNGTPNLVDKFIRGAGNLAVGATGGSADVVGTTDGGGAHSHTGVTGGTVLTVAQLPAHAHTITDPGHIHGVTDPGHFHAYNRYTSAIPGNAYSGGSTFLADQSRNTSPKVTGITVDNHTTGLTINNEGSGEGHSHAINTEPVHVHTFSVANANLPPWVALAFIMKLP